MENNTIIPIILAGGVGSRLWPISSKSLPKQFIKIAEEKSSFQGALERASLISNHSIIISVKDHIKHIDSQINYNHNQSTVVYEPIARNTSAAILSGAFIASHKYSEDSLVLIMPSDHMFADNNSLLNAIHSINPTNIEDEIICFGIYADKPNPSFGNIIPGEPTTNGLYEIEKFTEKPQDMQLTEYDECFWNSGMYLARAKTLISEIKNYTPETYNTIKRALQNSNINEDKIFLVEEDYKKIENISIDRLVIENYKKLLLKPLNTFWKDIGSIQGLWEFSSIYGLCEAGADSEKLIFNHEEIDSELVAEFNYSSKDFKIESTNGELTITKRRVLSSEA